MQKRDGIRLLPQRITETLVRAFAALPAVNTDVLILQPAAEPRAPLWEIKDDYNVLWMGEKVGRIYLNIESFEAREFNRPRYWGFSHPTLGRSVYGRDRGALLTSQRERSALFRPFCRPSLDLETSHDLPQFPSSRDAPDVIVVLPPWRLCLRPTTKPLGTSPGVGISAAGPDG
jgi:hypothetical protein